MNIDLISKLSIFPVLLIGLGTAYVVAPLIGIKSPKHRYSSIDGLRAYLAMFVFLHHSAIWFALTQTHKWGYVPSYLYNHFGSTSVAFFFMITAFLFFSKLISSFSSKLDWTKLYVSRVMRIMPLYIGSVFILSLTTGFISHFILRESLQNLLLHISQWIFFMEPDINKIPGTRYLNSGVQWSLAYEWAFYCSLPVIGWFFFRIRTHLTTIILTLFFLAIFMIIIAQYYSAQEWKRMMPFLTGLVTAFLARNEKVKVFCTSKSLSPLLVALFCIVVFFYPTIYEPIPYLCISFVFIAIACGNTLFGILTTKASLLLGQISYSIYLLHGFILFITFYFVIGFERSGKLPIVTFWTIICICSLLIIIISSLTYYFLEKSGIDGTENIANKIRQRLKKKRIRATAVP